MLESLIKYGKLQTRVSNQTPKDTIHLVNEIKKCNEICTDKVLKEYLQALEYTALYHLGLNIWNNQDAYL